MHIASLSSGSLSVGASAGIAISGVVVLVTLCVVIITICYHKAKRSHAQNTQMSRIASATAASEFQNTIPKASAPAPQENVCSQPPPSYTTTQLQQYPYPYPGDQYEMQPYPQYSEYPPEYPVDPPYPDHATYPSQQYYPAVGDTSKYYPQ